MKRRVISLLAVISLMSTTLFGCGPEPKTNNQTGPAIVEATETEEETVDAEEPEGTNMGNPIQEIDNDADYELVGMEWDTTYFVGSVNRAIIGGEIAQAEINLKNTAGENVCCTLRGTRRSDVAGNPIEALAGIYGTNFSATEEVIVPVAGTEMKINKTREQDLGIDVYYWDYDGNYYTLTIDGKLSQDATDALCELVMQATGITARVSELAKNPAGKRVEPLPMTVNVKAPEDGKYSMAIQSITDQDGQLVVEGTLYTADLYDAVDITSLAVGDVIVINGEEMVVHSVEEGEPLDLRGNGLQAVYVINGGLMENGADFIAEEGGTFRYFGYDDHTTYTEQGTVVLTMAENGIFYDTSDLATPGGVKMSIQAFKEYLEEDEAMFFIPQNTTVRVEDGKIIEIDRIYIP